MDREGLNAFCHQSEGILPPVFKGRKTILATLRQQGENTRRVEQIPGHTIRKVTMRGIPKVTQILQGAPGAGKTSVLAKLQEQCAADEQNSAPRVVIVSSENIIGGLPQVLTLIRAAGELSSSKWKNLIARVGLNLTANSFGDISASVGWKMNAPDIPTTLDQLAAISPSRRWKIPVIVAVDEAQNLSGERDTDHARFLQSIHNASTGLSLTLVLAGLSDTKNRAQLIGLTRGVTTHNLHCLSISDRNDLVIAFCGKFGVDVRGYEPKLEALAESTEGWPRHLHFTLQALGKELLRVNGSVPDVQWSDVALTAGQSRVTYYQHQQSEIFMALKPLIGAVMEEHQRGDGFKTITNNIRKNLQPEMLDDLSDDVPELARFPRHLFQEMVHQGVLQEYAPDQFFSPIPSFRRHLIKDGLLTPNNPLPPRGTFKLCNGTIFSAVQSGFRSMTEARVWASKKVAKMDSEEDISLWYEDIPLEIIRTATLCL